MMMNTTNVESNRNSAKGPVFLDVDLSENIVLSAGEFTTDRFEEFGVQEIGNIQRSHNIIDDNMVGFRIVEEGKSKKVERIEQNEIQQIIKLLQDSDKQMSMPVKQSEIDLIKKETGYQLAIKDKSIIVDDVQEQEK